MKLGEFARDPALQMARFAVRKDRRQHLHNQIQRLNLDMTHVTDRVGSPQTLVCTKTRNKYQQACELHAQDLGRFHELLVLSIHAPRDHNETEILVTRLKEAVTRARG